MTKSIRTNSKVFRNEVRKHILDALDNGENETLLGQLKDHSKNFHSWYGEFEQKRTPNIQDAHTEFLMGLPHTINIEFETYEIDKAVKEWFENCGADYAKRDDEKTAQLYYYLVFSELSKLMKENNVPFGLTFNTWMFHVKQLKINKL